MSTQLDPDDELTAFGLPISTERDEIQDELHAGIQERMPGWQPLPTHPLTHLVGALASTVAANRDALQTRMRDNLVDLLGLLFGIPRGDGLAASSTLTITARDALGHSEPGPIAANIGDLELEIPDGITIPAGQTTAVVGVVVTETGAAANGATGTVETTAFDWLASTNPVTLNAPLIDGEDPEDDDPYFLRMVEELQTRRDTLVMARDYAISARRHQGVAFAWTLPHYQPAQDPANDNAQAVDHVTTVALSATGGAITAAARIAVEQDINARLLDNVVHHLVDPISVPISVTATVARRPGFAAADVKAAAEAQLTTLLQPQVAAIPRFGDDPNPMPSRVIHKNELIARLDDVDSLDYVTSLQIGNGSSDRVTLKAREMPAPGTITVTVVDA